MEIRLPDKEEPLTTSKSQKWWMKYKDDIMVWTSIGTLLVSVIQLVLTIVLFRK